MSKATSLSSRRSKTIWITLGGAAIIATVLTLAAVAILLDRWPRWLELGSFIPDLVVGLFTGLIIGLVVIWLERRASKALELRLALDEWGRAKRRIIRALNSHRSYQMPMIDERFSSLLDLNVEFVELADELPLERWGRVIRDDEAVAKIADLAAATHRFRSAAELASAQVASYAGIPHNAESVLTPIIYTGLPQDQVEEFLYENNLPSDILAWPNIIAFSTASREFDRAWLAACRVYGIS